MLMQKGKGTFISFSFFDHSSSADGGGETVFSVLSLIEARVFVY